jgi:hypothetical protein
VTSSLPIGLEADLAEGFDNLTPREERELRQRLQPSLLWFAV